MHAQFIKNYREESDSKSDGMIEETAVAMLLMQLLFFGRWPLQKTYAMFETFYRHYRTRLFSTTMVRCGQIGGTHNNQSLIFQLTSEES